jgi:hypothetical protein
MKIQTLKNPTNFSSNDFSHSTLSNTSSGTALIITRTGTVTSLIDTSLAVESVLIEAGICIVPPGASHIIDAADIIITTAAKIVLLFDHEVSED